jgi:putative chitinase
MFIGQIAHESAYFSRVEELLNYSAERLIAVWPSRFKTLEQAKQYARNPEKLANLVYGGRMGNKDVGDGYRYRGRGLKQLTGRFNYAAATIGLLDQLGVDYEANPDAVIEPKHAAWTAAWFWSWKRLNGLTAQGKFQTVTRIINGGLTDHDKRMNLYQKAMACQ